MSERDLRLDLWSALHKARFIWSWRVVMPSKRLGLGSLPRSQRCAAVLAEAHAWLVTAFATAALDRGSGVHWRRNIDHRPRDHGFRVVKGGATREAKAVHLWI